MKECPKCGRWMVAYDHVREEKKCYNSECDYKEYYCRNRWDIEHDVLWKLVGKEKQDAKCMNPKGLCECDDCELRG